MGITYEKGVWKCMELQEWLELITFILALLPIALRLFVYLGQLSSNTKIKNLVERSNVIVSALEKSGLTNEDKKSAALSKLAIYADEVGIKMTRQQLEDYIQSSVMFIKELKKLN